MKINFKYILIFCVIISGCASTGTQQSAKEIFDEANTLSGKGKVEKAAEAFMKVRTYYPGDDLAKDSLLLMSDMYYKKEHFTSALTSYLEFKMLYPTDIKSDYCQFRIAMCHFKQMLPPDRDQEETVEAIEAFLTFIKLYPSSPYVPEAEKNMKEARIILAKNNIYIGKFYLAKNNIHIGKFYLRKKNSQAACERFKFTKQQFSGIGLDEELDELIKTTCGN